MSLPALRRVDVILGVLIVALALVVRLWDLDRRALNHPENYVPGIPMPSWVDTPPPRAELDQLRTSILKDAHPPLYYLAMFAWVKSFGFGTFALRLPSVLMGAATVLVLWRLALREAGRIAALVAAALLALHGHHIYWSQTARMYAAATFLSLLSTFFLWKVMENGRRRFQIAYALSAMAALWTQIYCWPVMVAQIVWATLRSIRSKGGMPALPAQFAAVIFSIPVLALAVYQWRPNVCADPRLEFFELGYLFWSQAFFFEAAPAPPVSHAVLLALGAVAVGLGILARPVPAVAGGPSVAGVPDRQTRVGLLASGALVAAALTAAAFRAFHPGTRQFVLVIILAAVTVLAGAAFPRIFGWLKRLEARDGGLIAELAARVRRASPILMLLPLGCVLVAGSLKDVFVARGAMIFVPYALLLAATGFTVVRPRWIAVPAVAGLIAIHALSVPWSLRSEHSPRDYKAFADALSVRLAPDDLILLTNRYSDPPLLYYFPTRFAQFVPDNWESAVAGTPSGKVWVVLYEDQEMPPAMAAAVRPLKAGAVVTAPGSRALEFVR